VAAAPAAERLEAAQFQVKRVCGILIAPTPEAFNSCQAALETAVFELREFRSAGPERSHASSLACLRAEVLRAGRLLENLAGFYRGWERRLGTMSGGYITGGNPAPVVRAGRICCRG
jgi:hypothetical protein